jgi:hypothetical protein
VRAPALWGHDLGGESLGALTPDPRLAGGRRPGNGRLFWIRSGARVAISSRGTWSVSAGQRHKACARRAQAPRFPLDPMQQDG